MKKTFTFEYDEEKPGTLSYQLSLEEDERVESSVENGVPFLYLNRSAAITIAKILIQMATGPYADGFHVHLHEHFDVDAPESLVVVLSSKDTKNDSR